MNYFIIAQIFGLISFIVGTLMIITNKKKNVIIYNTIVNFANSMQYAFLGAFTGALSLVVMTIRNVLFAKYKNKKIPIIFLFLIIIFEIITFIISYDNLISILPCLSVILFSYGIWQNNIKVTKIVNIIVSLFGMVHDIYYMAYITAFAQLIYITIGIYSYVKIKNKKKKTN